jgi:nucleotide-binding universal stress UspA family protein
MTMHEDTRLRRVLVGLDFSAASQVALERAAMLPLAADARVRLVHVHAPRSGADGEEHATVATTELRLSEAAEHMRRVLPEHFSGRLQTQWQHGATATALLRLARATSADLVVLGAHGRRAIRDVFVGSTAELVAWDGAVAALVVKRAGQAGYRRPLLAIPAQERSPQLARLGAALAAHDALLTVVHVLGAEATPAPTVVAACRELDAAAVAFRAITVPGSARQRLLEVVAREAPDLLVLSTRRRRGRTMAAPTSLARSLLREAACDVLVVPEARSRGRSV